MEPIAIYAVAGAVGAAILLQVFVAQVWSRRTIHQVRASSATQQYGFALPYFGHVFQLLFYGDGFLRQARDGASPPGRFSIRLFGRILNVIYDRHLIDSVEELESSSLDADSMTLQVLENAFSLPSKPAALDAALKQASSRPNETIQNTTQNALIKAFELHLPDFVSYMSSLIDQSLWERDAIISVSEDHNTATVAFHELLRNFITHYILLTLLPPYLLETHPHAQTFVADLWKLNSATFLLALGLPRWLPIPALTAAHISRRNLLWTLTGLFLALDKLDAGADPVGEWENLDAEDVPPFLRDFQASARDAPPEARASLMLAKTLALSVEASNLALWCIANLSADPSLLEQLRAETASAACAEQPPSDFGISEPVRIRLDVGALEGCGTLLAVYTETSRLYNRSFGFRHVEENCSLDNSGNERVPKARFLKGSYVVTAPWLYNTDASEFLHARKWWPERHLSIDSVDDGEVLVPRALMATLAGGDDLVRKIVLAFVAGFISIWDVELDSGVPSAARSVSVAGPKGEVRARVRRREIAEKKELHN